MPEARLKAKLVLCNVPSTEPGAAREFYGTLLGSDDFARSFSERVQAYHRPLSADGIDLTLTQRFDDRERITCYFAVENLQETLAQLERVGARVVMEITELPIGPDEARRYYQQQEPEAEGASSLGRFTVVLDPDGNHVGLVELEAHAHRHYRWGAHQRPLEDDQLQELAGAIETGRRVLEGEGKA